MSSGGWRAYRLPAQRVNGFCGLIILLRLLGLLVLVHRHHQLVLDPPLVHANPIWERNRSYELPASGRTIQLCRVKPAAGLSTFVWN